MCFALGETYALTYGHSLFCEQESHQYMDTCVKRIVRECTCFVQILDGSIHKPSMDIIVDDFG